MNNQKAIKIVISAIFIAFGLFALIFLFGHIVDVGKYYVEEKLITALITDESYVAGTISIPHYELLHGFNLFAFFIMPDKCIDIIGSMEFYSLYNSLKYLALAIAVFGIAVVIMGIARIIMTVKNVDTKKIAVAIFAVMIGMIILEIVLIVINMVISVDYANFCIDRFNFNRTTGPAGELVTLKLDMPIMSAILPSIGLFGAVLFAELINKFYILRKPSEELASPLIREVPLEAYAYRTVNGKMFASDFRADARYKLANRWGTVIAMTLLYMIIASICSATIVLTPILTMGYMVSFMCINRRLNFKITTIFDGFKRVAKILGTYFLMMLYIFLWTLLLIVPGIIKALSYSQAMYIIAENPDIPVREALRLSENMMKGNKGRLFCLLLSFIGWLLLGVITFGIVLILYVVPYMEAATASFHDEMKREYNLNNAAPQPQNA